MTIGMLIESLVGKHAAISGTCEDASPYTFGHDVTAHKYIGTERILLRAEFVIVSGDKLRNTGFSYGGIEPVASVSSFYRYVHLLL